MQNRAMKKATPEPNIKSDPDVRSEVTEDVQQEAIAARAYELWQQRGSPIGSPETDWLRAEEELKNRTAVSTAA